MIQDIQESPDIEETLNIQETLDFQDIQDIQNIQNIGIMEQNLFRSCFQVSIRLSNEKTNILLGKGVRCSIR